MKIAIIGSGDFGQQIAHMIKTDTNHDVVGFYDDFAPKNKEIIHLPILGGLGEIKYDDKKFDEIICGIGYKHLNKKLEICRDLELQGVKFYTFIHSSAFIDSSATIEKGSVIFPRAVVDQRVYIGAQTVLNLGAIVSHDTHVNEGCFLAPNMSIAGFCKVGKCCNLGISSTVIDNISICNDVILGGSALVVRDINESGLFVGSPCFKIK